MVKNVWETLALTDPNTVRTLFNVNLNWEITYTNSTEVQSLGSQWWNFAPEETGAVLSPRAIHG